MPRSLTLWGQLPKTHQERPGLQEAWKSRWVARPRQWGSTAQTKRPPCQPRPPAAGSNPRRGGQRFSPPAQQLAGFHSTLVTQAPKCSLSSLGSRLPLGEGPQISLCSKARGPGWRGSLRRALPPLGRRGWDRALSQVSHRNAAAVRQARPHRARKHAPGKHSCADTGATQGGSPPSAAPAQGAHGHLALLGMCQGRWIPCPLELSGTSMVPIPRFPSWPLS